MPVTRKLTKEELEKIKNNPFCSLDELHISKVVVGDSVVVKKKPDASKQLTLFDTN